MERTQCFVCGDHSDNTNYLINLQSKKYKSLFTTLISDLINSEYEIRVTNYDCICEKCTLLLEKFDQIDHEVKQIKSVLARQIAYRYKIETDYGQVFLDKSKVFFPLRDAGSNKFNCKHCPNYVTDNIDVINAHVLYHQYRFEEEKNSEIRVQPMLTKKATTITREVVKKPIEPTRVAPAKSVKPPVIKPSDPAKSASQKSQNVSEMLT